MSGRTKRKASEFINAPDVDADDALEEQQAIKVPQTPGEWENHKRLIVVLEKASLEVVTVRDSFELLNSTDHASILRKHNRDPADVRPDITAGRLQVFIHTAANVLIEVNPQLRIPRTFKRFCGLMVQLLRELKIRATDSPGHLLRVIKNPVTDYFPTKCRRIVDIAEYAFKADIPDQSVAVSIGAIARGDVRPSWAEETIAYSQYPLSAALACAKLTDAYERTWGIL